MTNNRKSVATNSLRLRPVCSFQPSGPSSSTRVFSTKWCTSSASAPNFSSHPVSVLARPEILLRDRKSTRLNSSHRCISYAVFCLKKKKHTPTKPYVHGSVGDNTNVNIQLLQNSL